MPAGRSKTNGGQLLDGKWMTIVLAIAYLGVGIGLFYSLATDSMNLFLVALAGTLVVIVGSLGIMFRREGVITPENKLIGGFVLIAMGLLFGLSELTDLSFELIFGIVFVVGVLIPMFLLEHTAYGADE